MITKRIYLDNGATTKVDSKVETIMKKYFSENYGNASSLHTMGREAKDTLEEARKTIAKSINAAPEEIIFTSGGTESDNLAIKGIAYAEGKGHIITTKIEHPAVLSTCKELEKEGFSITYLDVDQHGLIDLKKLESAIKKDTILITIMHANNEIGTIEPIEDIGKIAQKHNITFHSDAVQTYTKIPIDVKKINIDLISISAHKIHGPKGVGALYIKNGTKIKPLFNGGGHERRLRPGTENIASIAGFAEAVKIKSDSEKIKILRDYMIKEILKIPDTKLNGHPIIRLVNNVNISFAYIEGESMLFHLDNAGIFVSTGSACSSHSLEPSHVLKAIESKPEYMQGTIRFTLSRFTTKEEVNYTIKKVKEIVPNLRKMSPLVRN